MKWWHLVLVGVAFIAGGLVMKKQIGDKMAKVRESRVTEKEEPTNG